MKNQNQTVKHLLAMLLACLMLLSYAPAFAENESVDALLTRGVIKGGNLKLRSAPSSEARVIDTYAEGTDLIVLRSGETWCEVQVEDNVGYMMTKYLKITPAYTSCGYVSTSQADTFLNLHSDADAASPVCYKFMGGAVFEVVENLGAWLKVRSGTVVGYLDSTFATPIDAELPVFTYIGDNNPFGTRYSAFSFRQEIGSGKGMSSSKNQFSYTVRYPVLALGVADAQISSSVRTLIDAAQLDHTQYHADTAASLSIDYEAEKLDDNYALITLVGTYQVSGLNQVDFIRTVMVHLTDGLPVEGLQLFSDADRILFQIETRFDKVFNSYVKEYCVGLKQDHLAAAVLSRSGVELYFDAGTILPLHMGPQHFTLPYSRTYDLLALDTPVVRNNSRKIDPTKPMIALTFDDGPSEQTLRILAELERFDSRGTFCVVGSRLEAYESVLRETVASGMEIANHTWSHKNLEKISADNARSQISRVNDLVYEMTGYRIRVLRPPYGANNKRVRSICADLDMYLAHWKLDSEDWISRNSSKVYKKIMREVENGAIILCHDLYSTTADAVIQAIPELISDGYQLVTVTELLSFHKDGIIPGTTYSRIDPENIDVNK